MTYVLDKTPATTLPADLSRRIGLFLPVRSRRLRTALAGLPLMAAFLLLWEIAPRLGWLNAIFFPPLSKVLQALGQLIGSGELAAHVGISLQRAAIGFALAIIVAIPLGFIMGRYRRFDRAADLLVQTLRNTSQFALMPVFILILGIGEASKIAITFYAAVFFILINTIVGVRGVDPLLLKAARSMGTSERDLFRKVIFPSSIPSIVAGARLGVKSSLFSVIAAEMLAAQSGIGFLIQHSQLMLDTPVMYAGIITLTIIGLVVNYGLVWIEQRATRWRTLGDDAGDDMPH